MTYLVGKSKYELSYQKLKALYINFCQMSDEEFLENIIDATHLAIIICFLKEIKTDICLSDKGIIHELVHLQTEGGTTTLLPEIRKDFEEVLKLA
jgi:hypothetical protein